jgi:integrase
VEFQLQTGLRTGEVRALRWADITGDKLTVHANYTLTHGLKHSTKTNKVRTVQLNAKALAVLEQLSRENEYLFPWSRESFQSLFDQRMRPLYRQGLISHKYRPYDLRHTAISRWLSTDVQLALAAKWAGNTRDVLVKHYLGVTEEQPMPVL